MKNYLSKKYLFIFSYFLVIVFLVSCTNKLGTKENWNKTYKKEFIANCKAEIKNEESLLKIDSLTIANICGCIASKAEKEFEPLKMEEQDAQPQMKIISTDCAREILIKN